MRSLKGALIFTIGLLTVEGAVTFKKMVGICNTNTRGERIQMWRDKNYAFCEAECAAKADCNSFTLGNGNHMYDGTCDLHKEATRGTDGIVGWECWVKDDGVVGKPAKCVRLTHDFADDRCGTQAVNSTRHEYEMGACVKSDATADPQYWEMTYECSPTAIKSLNFTTELDCKEGFESDTPYEPKVIAGGSCDLNPLKPVVGPYKTEVITYCAEGDTTHSYCVEKTEDTCEKAQMLHLSSVAAFAIMLISF